MSVSSASLNPRSKSTALKAASCGHVLFLLVTFRAAPWSTVVEERLPPKSASATSFRCKDGRSARPYRGYKNRETMNYGMENLLKNVFKMMKILAFWFFRCNIVECKSPPIQKQQSETVIHLELQYVLGTPLAANQQLAMSTERNATSLHRIENPSKQHKIHKSWHIAAALKWSSLVLGHPFEPKVRHYFYGL